MKPYQPSNKVTNAGFAWLLGSSILSGVTIGGIAGFISLWVYLIVLFPAVMGLFGIGAMSIAIRQGKVRNPAIATVFGGLTGLIIFTSIHAVKYQQFKQLASESITQEAGRLNDSQMSQVIDRYLQQQTGSTGFVGYVKYEAKLGVTIIKAGTKGGNIGEMGTWIYWITELGVVSVWIAMSAYSSAKEPFCENCNQWYGGKERLGNVNPQLSTNFLNLLESDNFSEAGKLVDPLQGVYAPSLEVYLQRSPSPSSFSDLLLTVSDTSLDDKGNLQLKEVTQGLISLSQYSKFNESVTEGLSQNPEQNTDNAEIHLAQLERSNVSAKDVFEPHGLISAEEANIVAQMESQSHVKEAYLVRKKLEHFPDKPLYVLGVVRKVGLIDSSDAATNLHKKLMTELKLPIQTWIVFLNKDKAMLKALQQITGTPLYQKK